MLLKHCILHSHVPLEHGAIFAIIRLFAQMFRPIIILFFSFLQGSYALMVCYGCASRNLQFQWYLTGYADSGKPADDYFFDACLSSSDDDVKQYKHVPCTTNCIAYAFQRFDSRSGTMQPYIVRGCLDQLTGVTMPPLTTPRCESGSQGIQDANGNPVKTFTQICSADNCNSRTFLSSDADCNTGLYGGPLTPISCAQCGPATSDCVPSQRKCYGATWCTKMVTTLNGQTNYTHGCSSVNPVGQPNCTTVTSSGFIMSRAQVQLKTTTCYCNNAADCNNASKFAMTKAMFIVWLFISAILTSAACRH